MGGDGSGIKDTSGGRRGDKRKQLILEGIENVARNCTAGRGFCHDESCRCTGPSPEGSDFTLAQPSAFSKEMEQKTHMSMTSSSPSVSGSLAPIQVQRAGHSNSKWKSPISGYSLVRSNRNGMCAHISRVPIFKWYTCHSCNFKNTTWTCCTDI